jgi:phosphoserine phosphatase RsbU/P
VVATFFEPSGRLTVCNAGHPRPLLYRAAKQRWEFLGHLIPDGPSAAGPSNLPLGLLEMSAYDQFDIELEPGDCVLSYTDGLMESCDTSGEMLGEDGVLRILRLVGQGEPQKLIEKLLAEIGNRHPKNLTEDDVTVLLVRASGKKALYSFGQKLGALRRLSGLMLRALHPKAERPPLPDLNLANMGGAIIPALGRRWRAKRKEH